MGLFDALFKRKKHQKKIEDQRLDKPKKATSSANQNITYIKNKLNHTSDLKIQRLDKIILLHIESVADQEKIQKEIMSHLYETKKMADIRKLGEKTPDLNQAVQSLLKGDTLLCLKWSGEILTYTGTTAVYNRPTEEPENEKVVRGAHDGFVENLLVNINLIRKRIESPDLCVRYFKVGKKTNTNIAIAYMKQLADPKVVHKIERRIQAISIDMVMSPGYIEEFVESTQFSPFPQLLNTERPDRAMGHIMEGRVAVLSEGSPTVLILPVTFFAFYQSPDDYNSRWLYGTYVRLIRLMSFLIAIVLPAFYIAVIGFHFEVIPDKLVLPIKSSVNDIAYPPIVEALVMVITLELIREAGIRLPTPIGQTIGIVGGLVIGDAVVRAGLISNIMIVIIALTAIAAYVVPASEMSNTLRILVYPLIIAASMFGFVGIVFAVMAILIHLCKLESFGTPYLTPIAPLRIKDLKDTFVRVPIPKMKRRPSESQAEEVIRQENSREWKNNGRKKR